MKRKTGARLLAALLILLALPGYARAAGPVDTAAPVSLTVSCRMGGEALVGVRASLYLAAQMDETGDLTWVEPVRSFPVQLEGLDAAGWQRAAQAVESYLLSSGAACAASGVTGPDGTVTLPAAGQTLAPGLYLVSIAPHRQGGWRYEAEPFFVLLPGRDAETDAWVYAGSAAPKFRRDPEPAPPDTDRREVVKLWADGGDASSRPEEVKITLLCDGAVWDTASLRAETGWSYAWEKLPAGHRWQVIEAVPDGYSVLTWQDGQTLYVENTPDTPPAPQPEEPAQPGGRLPQTGQLWWPVPVLLGAGLLLMIAGLLRRRGHAA